MILCLGRVLQDHVYPRDLTVAQPHHQTEKGTRARPEVEIRQLPALEEVPFPVLICQRYSFKGQWWVIFKIHSLSMVTVYEQKHVQDQIFLKVIQFYKLFCKDKYFCLSIVSPKFFTTSASS